MKNKRLHNTPNTIAALQARTAAEVEVKPIVVGERNDDYDMDSDSDSFDDDFSIDSDWSNHDEESKEECGDLRARIDIHSVRMVSQIISTIKRLLTARTLR